ncbi:hypothetical protein ACFFRS_27400, partial [Saccharopolyspora hordei]|uniref:hypothetical protein n=1 Tax=Saccharopolyspora hordei TaxID=1838 RepID=UPI0035E68D6E
FPVLFAVRQHASVGSTTYAAVGVQLSFNFVVIAETEHSSAEEVTQCTNNLRLFNVAPEIRHNLGAILSDIVLMVNFRCDCLQI